MSAPLATFTFQTEDETAEFAVALGALLHAGDTLLLDGPVGAGKTFFARALIQSRLGYVEDVPSPTFTLVQTYALKDYEIWHCDLYRLTHPDETIELGLDEAFETAICIIEWPDRLGTDAPKSALSMSFTVTDDRHSVVLFGNADWQQRLRDLHV